jgi:translocation and assembly module TamA
MRRNREFAVSESRIGFVSVLLSACLSVLSLTASSGAAAEASLSAPGAPDDMVKALQDASRSLAAAEAEGATAQDIFAAARSDYARLIGVLYARGYYGPVINIRVDGREAADITPLSVPARIDRVDITVRTGPPFAFSRADIGPLAPETDLPKGYAVGAPAASTVIVEAARAGVNGWRDASHAKAEVSGQQVTADHDRATLDARIGLAPGPAVTFGRLLLKGHSAVRPDRIRAIAGFPEGVPYSPSELEESSNRLRGTGAFRAVRFTEADRLGPGGVMDVTLEVVDDKPRRIAAGVEVSSSEGVNLTGMWMHRNLTGAADRLRFDAEISGIGGSDTGGVNYSLGTRYDRPALIGSDTGLYLAARLESLDEPDYTEETAGIGGGLTRNFTETLSGEAGVLLNYARVDDDLGQRDMTHLMFPARLTWDRRNDELDPSKGFYLYGDLTPMAALAGDAESGARLYSDARIYQGLGERLVMAGRMQFGSIMGASAEGVPASMLFYSGGGGTVRGQPYESLAVELPNGDRIGGRSFLGFSAEARVGVTDTIGVVLFADAGIGLRYNTGIGPIRVDIAGPVSGNTGDGVQFYIGIGQAF